MCDDVTLRRWLGLLHRPSKLDSPEMRAFLDSRGQLPDRPTAQTVGRAAVKVLTHMIEQMRPQPGAPNYESLPYRVLKTCFVDGEKCRTAAVRLKMSERQLTRERGRAIALLAERVSQMPPPQDFVPEQAPAVDGFVPRPAIAMRLEELLREHRLARVHGPPGAGKTCVVAELAASEPEASMWWHQFRKDVNDSLTALMIDLGHWLCSHGQCELAEYLQDFAGFDKTVATRIALRELGQKAPLIILDDFHHVEKDEPICLFIAEAVARIDRLRVVEISRYRPSRDECELEVQGLTLEETEALLLSLGIRLPREVTAKLHARTAGIPQFIKLAAPWMVAPPERDFDAKLGQLADQSQVQEYLLANTAALLDQDDRRVLQAAAVFRSRFSDDALAYVAELTRGAVQDASRRLVRAYVATRSARGNIAFVHSIVRNYIYDRLDADDRTRLHLRAAAWYHRVGDVKETSHHRAAAGLDAM